MRIYSHVFADDVTYIYPTVAVIYSIDVAPSCWGESKRQFQALLPIIANKRSIKLTVQSQLESN